MGGKFFLDTNILVYTFDATAPDKQKIARQLVATALETQQGVISYQVVQEFLHVATRQFSPPLTPADADTYLREVLTPLCEFFPRMEYYAKAMQISVQWKYSLYEAFVITAAIEAECETIYSEELQHKHTIEGVTIVNPFNRFDDDVQDSLSER